MWLVYFSCLKISISDPTRSTAQPDGARTRTNAPVACYVMFSCAGAVSVACACVLPGVPLCGTVVCCALNGWGAEHAALCRLVRRSLNAARYATPTMPLLFASQCVPLLPPLAWPHHAPLLTYTGQRSSTSFAAGLPQPARLPEPTLDTSSPRRLLPLEREAGRDAGTERLLQMTARSDALVGGASCPRPAQHAAAPPAGGNHAFVAAAARWRACAMLSGRRAP